MPSPALRKLEVEANAAFDQVSCDDYDAIGYCIENYLKYFYVNL